MKESCQTHETKKVGALDTMMHRGAFVRNCLTEKENIDILAHEIQKEWCGKVRHYD